MDELISKEALLRLIETMPSSPTTERENRLINAFITTVKNFPAADVRPVVRGKWETVMLDHERMGCRPTAHYCSECHQITWFRTFFCPNCGADMREERGGRVVNDTTFQENGKITYVPVVVNAKQQKQTNADRIRAMTDEELAKMMSPIGSGCPPAMRGGVDCSGQISCYRCWLDWLKEEEQSGNSI